MFSESRTRNVNCFGLCRLTSLLQQATSIFHPLYTPALALGNVILQLICVVLEILGAVEPFTLYDSVRLVLPSCRSNAAGDGSILNVFVASQADVLISFNRV